jgi:signal peptidase I
LQTDHPYPLDDGDDHPTQPHLNPLNLPSYQDLITAEQPTQVTLKRHPLEVEPREAAPVDDDQPTRRENARAVVREIVETLVLAAIIWLAVNFVTMRVMVVSISMEPNLYEGERLIVNRLAYRFSGEPERGDIIVFESPTNSKENLVKRVIGLPGETLTIENGVVHINGVRLEEPYVSAPITMPDQGRWTIPAGYYFVMGDNRPRSSDSRSWGMVSWDAIMGKAWIVYWPPKAVGVVPHYDYDTGGFE